MAKLTLISTGTPYIAIINASNQWYNGSTFEAYNAANWSTYDIAATQFTSSKVWHVTFPSISAGVYDVVQFLQAGGSPAVTDTPEGVSSFYFDATNLATEAQVRGIDANTVTASALATDAVNEISDGVLTRNVSNTEGTAGEHSLTGIVLMNTESSISGTVLTVKKTNGTDTFATKTVVKATDNQAVRGIS